MHLHYISSNNSVLNHFLGQIRDVAVQKDTLRFRKNIERIGEIMAYEMSKTFEYEPIEIQTPLGTKPTSYIKDKIVLCSILRAGLALHQGFMEIFDAAENGFVSAYRHHPNHDAYFEIKVEYQAVPSFNDKIVVFIDPMLATGQSLGAVLQKLLQNQNPKEIHIAVAIAAPEGIDFLEENLPKNCHLWVASLDEKLDDHNYIVPGLGDAGDLAFGEKTSG